MRMLRVFLGFAICGMLAATVGCRTFLDSVGFKKSPQRVVLKAVDADIHPAPAGSLVGETIQYELEEDRDNIGFWHSVEESVSWDFDLVCPGTYEVIVEFACDEGQEGSTYTVSVGDAELTAEVASTGEWGIFETAGLGEISISEAGAQTLTVKPVTIVSRAIMNLKSVTLEPMCHCSE